MTCMAKKIPYWLTPDHMKLGEIFYYDGDWKHAAKSFFKTEVYDLTNDVALILKEKPLEYVKESVVT